ncbi:MAG: hypothetical protein HC805_00170 [Alkalinema sp. RL_2_19]|nr:hypothetical protein [Alkalinema sp. RL_2_19]
MFYRHFIRSLLCLGVSLIYWLNGPGYSLSSGGDGVGNTLLIFNWIDHGSPNFNVLHAAQTMPDWFGGIAPFRLTPGGEWISSYPIGPAIVTAPLYLLFALYLKLLHGGVIGVAGGLAFEPTRLFYEKLASTIIATFSVGLFFQLAQWRCDRALP